MADQSADAVRDGKSDGSRDEAVGFGDRLTERGNSGANMGRLIVTNGDFLLLGIPIEPLRVCCFVNS